MITSIGLFLFVMGYTIRIFCDLLTPYWLRVVITVLLFGGASMLLVAAIILCLRWLP